MLNPFVLSDLVALAERCEAKTPPGPKPLRATEATRDAVGHAYALIERYVGGKITVTENGKFCQLAALLLNAPQSNDGLAAHCARYARDLKKKKAETRDTK